MLENLIWTYIQYLSLVWVQPEKVDGHPVVNGSKVAVQRLQIVVVFKVEQHISENNLYSHSITQNKYGEYHGHGATNTNRTKLD